MSLVDDEGGSAEGGTVHPTEASHEEATRTGGETSGSARGADEPMGLDELGEPGAGDLPTDAASPTTVPETGSGGGPSALAAPARLPAGRAGSVRPRLGRAVRGAGERVGSVRAAFSRRVEEADAARLASRQEQLRYPGADSGTADAGRTARDSGVPAGTVARTPRTASPLPAGAPGVAGAASSSVSERGAEGRAHEAVGASAPVVAPISEVTTRAAVLETLPSWLVRGGVGSWLLIGLVVVIGMVFFATSRIVPVFIGVFVALVISSLLQPLVAFFSRVMPRYPATFLSLLTALGVLAGLVFYVINSVTSQWSSLTQQFSDGVNKIMDYLENGPLPVHVTQQEMLDTIQNLVSQGQTYLQTNAPSLAGEVLSNAGSVVNVFVVLALAIFSAIFFLASGARMWRWFLNELPARLRESVHRAAGAGWYTFAGYARGTVILALTDAILAGVFLQIVGVPLAVPLAVLVFIGAFIPMIGAPTAMVIAMIVALATKGVVAMVVVGVGVAGIGQIEGHILQPLIMGRQVSLHPVVVGIAVAVGSFSIGLLGAVIAVPLVSVIWSVYSELHTKDAPVVGELPVYTTDHEE